MPVPASRTMHVSSASRPSTHTPVPSNGATTGDLDGASGDLVITADSTFDTTTGAITVDNGPVVRTMGFGLSPENMRYTDLGNSVAVLGVHRLTIAQDVTLRVAG